MACGGSCHLGILCEPPRLNNHTFVTVLARTGRDSSWGLAHHRRFHQEFKRPKAKGPKARKGSHGSSGACAAARPSAPGPGGLVLQAAGRLQAHRREWNVPGLRVLQCLYTVPASVLSYTQRVKILPAQDRPANGCVFTEFGSSAEPLLCSEHTSLYPTFVVSSVLILSNTA